MRGHAVAVGLWLLLGAVGCAQSSRNQTEDKAELGPELRSLVLEEAPSDLPNRTYVDFGGKLSLIGYAVTPASLAAPGSKLSLELFWRCESALDAGYELYTELVTPAGQRFEIEGSGPLRKGALRPSSWEPGKIYIDQLEVTVPEALEAARFAIVVGVKTAASAAVEPDKVAGEDKADAAANKADQANFGAVYLNVVSGLADAKHGAIIATLATGVTPGAKRARSAKERAGAARRPGMPAAKLPASALSRAPMRPLPPSAKPQQ